MSKHCRTIVGYTHTHSQTDAANHYTPVTLVGVSKEQNGSLTSFDMKAPLASKVPKEATSSTPTVLHSGRSETEPQQIWFSGTRHAELYGLLLPTFCLLLVGTSHLVIEVFARQLQLSGIVFPLTSVPAKLSQHSAVI